ncbi:MAG: carboxypeptidase-like regulatory domain-containing protein [Calditrichaceae bacterium]|nr:carboxypeptidase-like regulatory domain-containing protein [Calditrichaceae bacterium]
MNKFFMLIVLFLTSFLFANDFGFIAGTVVDKNTGETLPGVQIIIEGTDYGAVTNIEGYYEIYKVPPGEYELFIEYLGYTSIKVMGVKVVADSTTAINLKMDQGNI